MNADGNEKKTTMLLLVVLMTMSACWKTAAWGGNRGSCRLHKGEGDPRGLKGLWKRERQFR